MLQRKILSLSNLSLFESETIFSRKINYCYGFIPIDFQVLCGSMVGKNRQSPVSTETSARIADIPPDQTKDLAILSDPTARRFTVDQGGLKPY